MRKHPPIAWNAGLGRVLATVVALLLGVAAAQEGLFTPAALHGTYVWFIGDDVGPDEPTPNRVGSGLMHHAGDGTYRGVGMFSNQPGEPDADGEPTRTLEIDPHDPSGHLHFAGTVEMTPQGYFTLTTPFGDFHGVPGRVETIDGEPTLVEYRLVPSGANVNTGGAAIFEHTRLVDEDILPPAPEEAAGDEAP